MFDWTVENDRYSNIIIGGYLEENPVTENNDDYFFQSRVWATNAEEPTPFAMSMEAKKKSILYFFK